MTYQWSIIGAGPAGIAAVGKLLDHGVPPEEIAWIDPAFSVGDFGSIWRNVPSNTKVDLFLKFLNASPAFDYANSPIDFELNHAEKHKTCHLKLMADPLQWVSDHLKQKVKTFTCTAEKLHMQNRAWQIQLKDQQLAAKNVILAVGADAMTLPFPKPTVISLDIAMDATKINDHVGKEETIGVFGSSHSAILVLRNLIENSAKRVINFYRSPLLYAVYLKDWILFDDTGLKGPTAEWAREFIDGALPANLERVYSNNENIEHFLPQCDKVIYAVGFKRRTLPVVPDIGHLTYIEQAGIIAPGLFGFGIGFPEAKQNPMGILEYRVGLWKFMEYIERVLPIWLKYSP